MAISVLIFAAIGFIRSALTSVTRETVYYWRSEG
ncbi:uncharacterized protein METZ01_LOCUS188852, partial [marine metagenome]